MKLPFTLLAVMLAASVMAGGINLNSKRSEELRLLMWKTQDKDFALNEPPAKWASEPAVILAKSVTMFYKKEVMMPNLLYNQYIHIRVKLQNSQAVEHYAQFSLDGSGQFGAVASFAYAGFKVIKPDGREIEVPVNNLPKETLTYNNRNVDIFKLAIPNLEVGDILDYYIGEEQTISIYGMKFYAFDPFIFQLQTEYPVVKQRISFEVMRRCYINLKTTNGAPPFRLTDDEANDKSYYLLEDSDREGVREVRWLNANRELPTIKFKVMYAATLIANNLPMFLGEQGVIKSSVTPTEVKDLMVYVFRNSYAYYNELKAYMNRRFAQEKDPDKLAREAFYGIRNILQVSYSEQRLMAGSDPHAEPQLMYAVIALHTYFRAKKINHEVLFTVPRGISSLDDLILENELITLLKVNTSKPFYIGRLNDNTQPGEIDPDYQGQAAYAVNGLQEYANWQLKRVTVPSDEPAANGLNAAYRLLLPDLKEGRAQITVKRSVIGAARIPEQNELMDYYDYQAEENSRVVREDTKAPRVEKQLAKQREDYKLQRIDQRNKRLKERIALEFDFNIDSVHNFSISQTGRFSEHPGFDYSFSADTRDLVRKAGPNYLISVGKLIEKQTNPGDEGEKRLFHAYLPYPQRLRYQVEVVIPPGYSVQGVDKLNVAMENQWGAFTGVASVSGDKLTMTVTKVYRTHFVDRAQWHDFSTFLQQAFDFGQAQVLLVKNQD